MLKIDSKENSIIKQSLITVTLPEGKTQAEIIAELYTELKMLDEESLQKLYGSECHINGRLTTGMALCLGHFLAHTTKSVWMFDPKEGEYIKSVWH